MEQHLQNLERKKKNLIIQLKAIEKFKWVCFQNIDNSSVILAKRALKCAQNFKRQIREEKN